MNPPPDPTAAVIDCPVCKRTIWANSRCLHGLPPECSPVPADRPPVENKTGVTFRSNPKRKLKGGLE